jgi:hypothetical protein
MKTEMPVTAENASRRWSSRMFRRVLLVTTAVLFPLCTLQAATGPRVSISLGPQSPCVVGAKGHKYYSQVVIWTNDGRTSQDYSVGSRWCPSTSHANLGCQPTSCQVTLTQCVSNPNWVRVAIKGSSPAQLDYQPKCAN